MCSSPHLAERGAGSRAAALTCYSVCQRMVVLGRPGWVAAPQEAQTHGAPCFQSKYTDKVFSTSLLESAADCRMEQPAVT